MSKTIKAPDGNGFFVPHTIKGRIYWYRHVYNPDTQKMDTKREDPPNGLIEQHGWDPLPKKDALPSTTLDPTTKEVIKKYIQQTEQITQILHEFPKDVFEQVVADVSVRMKWAFGAKRGTDGKLYKKTIEQMLNSLLTIEKIEKEVGLSI